MTTVTPNRRERLRSATVTEIRQAARQLLVSGGPQALSLRKIAGYMGMTAPAIYRYFPSRRALVADLCEALYGELGEVVEAARALIPAEQTADRLLAMARAFRRWSIDHPAEFALMFGEPIADHPQPDEALPPPEGAPNFCAAFIAEYAELWRKHRFATPPPEVLHDRFLDRLSPLFAEYRDLLPPEVIYLFLSGWIRLYGLVAMEVFGHLSWAVTDVEPLFETDMAAYFHQLMERH